MSDRKTEEPRLEGSDEDTSWSYRGYRVASGGFATAMVHFYRGEISRANIWRSRLDTTTNWAVVTAGAVITFSFGAAGNTHVVILLGMFLILQFLMMESRRYRYYELWALRVRLMETDFFATLLAPGDRLLRHLAGSSFHPPRGMGDSARKQSPDPRISYQFLGGRGEETAAELYLALFGPAGFLVSQTYPRSHGGPDLFLFPGARCRRIYSWNHRRHSSRLFLRNDAADLTPDGRTPGLTRGSAGGEGAFGGSCRASPFSGGGG